MVDKLLVALWHAEFQCRYGLYRTGLIMLAEISMEFGLSQKSRRMVEDIMPQVIEISQAVHRVKLYFRSSKAET